jgi:hypothetical protein
MSRVKYIKVSEKIKNKKGRAWGAKERAVTAFLCLVTPVLYQEKGSIKASLEFCLSFKILIAKLEKRREKCIHTIFTPFVLLQAKRKKSK